LKRLLATELANAPFARQSEVERAVDDAFLSAVRDGANSDESGAHRGPKHQKTSRGARMKRADRPGRPKTFGSRSR
jgi:excinuclease ABC subunit B